MSKVVRYNNDLVKIICKEYRNQNGNGKAYNSAGKQLREGRKPVFLRHSGKRGIPCSQLCALNFREPEERPSFLQKTVLFFAKTEAQHI